MKQLLLSLSDISRSLDVSHSRVEGWIRRGKFPEPIRIGKRKRWKAAEISDWVLSLSRSGDPQPMPPKLPTPERPSFIYFIGCAGFIKIGVAFKPARRMAELQTANPCKLILLATTPGGFRFEGELHERFADHRVRDGGEWFHDCEEIRAFIATCGEGQS